MYFADTPMGSQFLVQSRVNFANYLCHGIFTEHNFMPAKPIFLMWVFVMKGKENLEVYCVFSLPLQVTFLSVYVLAGKRWLCLTPSTLLWIFSFKSLFKQLWSQCWNIRGWYRSVDGHTPVTAFVPRNHQPSPISLCFLQGSHWKAVQPPALPIYSELLASRT